MYNNGFEVAPATRVKIARVAIETMLLRASRIVSEAESHGGRVAIMPADTFRMNLLALFAALDGETRAECLALDDQGAALIAEVLHEGEGQTTVTVPTVMVDQARQLYETAALAGKEVEARGPHVNVEAQLYRPVAAAAMMLGEILRLAAKVESGERDAE
jgi:hypothetical protein